MQIQKIESHEFDEVSQTISNPAQHPNGNGKTSTTPILTELQEDDDLTPEEEQQLAGFNPATPQLISEEYRLKQDQESAVERPLAERASIRLGSVVAVVGTVMGAGAVLWFGFLQPRPPARPVTQSPTPTPTTPPTFDETAELKSRLAFQDQQQQLQPESAARSQSPVPSRPMASRSTAPAPTPAAVSPPITASRPDPVIVRSPVTPPERIQPIERVDPFQRWAQLANVGQLRVSSGAMEPSRTASNDRPGAQSNPSPSATQQNPVIPVVSIGRTETESSSLIYCARAQTLGLVGVRGVLPDRGSTPAPRSSDDPVVAKVRQLLELMRTENMTASEAAQSVGIPLDVLESLAGLVREARGLSVQSGNNLSAISRAWKLD